MEIEMIEPDAPLTLQTRAALALNSTHTERDLVALASKHTNIVHVIDKPGREQAHGAAMELKRARTSIEKVSKAAREDATQFQKAIIAEEKRLIALVEPEEARLVSLRDAYDDEQARLKAEAEAKERARITAIHERIASVKASLQLVRDCRTSERMLQVQQRFTSAWVDFNFEDDFQEFGDEAQRAYDQTAATIQQIIDDKLSDEAERAKLQAERAALEKEKAELAAAKAEQKAIQMRDEQAEREARAAEELAAYKAAINAAPVVDAEIDFSALTPVVKDSLTVPAMTGIDGNAISPELAKQFEQTYPTRAVTERPTDMAIVEVLALHYRVHEMKILDWLLCMDLDRVTETLAAEFV